MASSKESMEALEALVNEFFDVRTTNERKHQIETLLNNFSNQEGAWQHCLFFLANTQNEYVMMYCLTVIENVINKQWIGMRGEDKGEIRCTLYKFLLSHHRRVPHFIRNKLGKLVIDIGRLDWPHFYPDFFSSILQLSQSSETVSLGIMMLQTASEELACPREDLSVSRKEELHRLLLDQVPSVLSILSGILESALEKHRHLVTATPPPSPTHGQAANSNQSLFSSSPLHTGHILSSMFSNRSTKTPFQSLPPLDVESHYLCAQALNCLAHYLSWIPLSVHINVNLLTTVFHFASFGCDPVPVQHETMNSENQMNSLGNNALLGTLAMGCINEVMSKNCIPSDFEDFLLQMFQNTFHLLQRLTKDVNNSTLGTTATNRLALLDENYVEKFTDFLRLFVTVHLRKFERNSQFPVLEFLALLFKYTFHQPTHEGYFACLDIWGTFLEYIHSKLKGTVFERNSILMRYKGAMVSLATQVLQKMQFKYNQVCLEELDDENLNDDAETEWQHFLRQSLEVIAKISDIMPSETYSILYPAFQENADIYIGLERYISTHSETNESCLQITAENECRRLHCSLRDLSSLLQGIGRLATHFTGRCFWERFPTAESVVEKLCHIITFSTESRLYALKTAAPSVLKTDFIEVHAQGLATVKAFCPWFSQYFVDSHMKSNGSSAVCEYIRSIVDSTVPNISDSVPKKVVHSSAHLLMSLTFTVRPSFIFSLERIKQLFAAVCQGQLQCLQMESQLLVYRSMANMLLLPWPNLPDARQEWSSRSPHFQHFIESLSAPLKQVREIPNLVDDRRRQEEAKPAIRWVLKVIGSLIENLTTANTRPKQICYQQVQEIAQSMLYLFPVYIGQSDVSEDMLDFFLSMFDVMRTQMSVTFAEQTIQTFLSLFTRDHIVDCIIHEGSAGCRVIEKFLKLLQQIVQYSGSEFKAFLPSTINLCMDQIYPVVAERQSPEVKQPLFELLYEILLHNWRYFFKTNIVDSLSGSNNETIENAEQFTKIMQAYGQSFLQPDINIFRQNLESLENLNSKRKLYQKALFKTVMLNQFLSVLLQTLILKSHDILQEEIVISIYNMASVDFSAFYGNFLSQFLTACESLDDNQKMILGQNFKHETDLPSFTQNIRRFVNDLRYYQLCNSSLPPGSVRI